MQSIIKSFIRVCWQILLFLFKKLSEKEVRLLKVKVVTVLLIIFLFSIYLYGVYCIATDNYVISWRFLNDLFEVEKKYQFLGRYDQTPKKFVGNLVIGPADYRNSLLIYYYKQK